MRKIVAIANAGNITDFFITLAAVDELIGLSRVVTSIDWSTGSSLLRALLLSSAPKEREETNSRP
jgi:hypothetical protein